MPGFDSNHYVLEHGMSFLFILRPVKIGFHYYVSCFDIGDNWHGETTRILFWRCFNQMHIYLVNSNVINYIVTLMCGIRDSYMNLYAKHLEIK